MAVGSRSAEECQQKYADQQATGSKTHVRKATASGKSDQKGTDLVFGYFVLLI